MAREEVGEDRPEEVRRGRRDREAKEPARRRPMIRDHALRLLQLCTHAPSACGEQLADLRGPEMTRRALERAHAEPALERGHAARQGGRRDLQLGGGAREGAAVDHAREHHDVGLIQHSCMIARVPVGYVRCCAAGADARWAP